MKLYHASTRVIREPVIMNRFKTKSEFLPDPGLSMENEYLHEQGPAMLYSSDKGTGTLSYEVASALLVHSTFIRPHPRRRRRRAAHPSRETPSRS